MPDEALPLLQDLLALTQALQTLLKAAVVNLQPEETDAADAADAADDLFLNSLVQVDQLLDQRQQLLERLAALPDASRQRTADTGPLLSELDRLSDGLLEALEIHREQLSSSQLEVSSSQHDLRHSYSALQAYLPSEQTESHYFEEQS